MIELKQVSKSFQGRMILNEISAIMESGKANLIIGSSGSGKTVLMKCIVGLFEVDSGKIFYNGKDLASMNDSERKAIRKEIGMLFQGSALFDSMTVEQNIMFPLEMFSKLSYKERRKRVNACLERVNLSGTNKKYPSEISGGMKKRVGIARAIVLNPKYLFCDEPNSGLDPQTAMMIDRLIYEITVEYQITTVVNTHDMNSVMETGDHILFLFDGKKQWEGNKKDIIFSKDEKLNHFIFASEFLQNAKQMRQIELLNQEAVKDSIEEVDHSRNIN